MRFLKAAFRSIAELLLVLSIAFFSSMVLGFVVWVLTGFQGRFGE